MEFAIGSIVFLSSMLLLAILARISASEPDPVILRGEFAPAFLAVLISSGLTIGPLMMAFAGEVFFASRSIELAAIAAFMIAAIWIIFKLVGRAARALPA